MFDAALVVWKLFGNELASSLYWQPFAVGLHLVLHWDPTRGLVL